MIPNARASGSDQSPNVHHDQVTTLLDSLRCAACTKDDYQCVIPDSDVECIFCTARNEPCILPHSVVEKGASAICSREGSVGSAQPTQEDQHNVYAKTGMSD
ncbi:hypothetical protein MMC28_002860 [Mycoblastus sanguinarius]|nr:hypothetical protein [Mycoblastus sanguinarius]